VADGFKAWVSQEMADIVLASGKEIVEAKDLISLDEKSFAEMRTKKASAAGNENPLHRFNSPSYISRLIKTFYQIVIIQSGCYKPHKDFICQSIYDILNT
jgi:hypothetical protein